LLTSFVSVFCSIILFIVSMRDILTTTVDSDSFCLPWQNHLTTSKLSTDDRMDAKASLVDQEQESWPSSCMNIHEHVHERS